MLLLFDELLKFPGFVLMRSVFCANIAKIDQSGPHVKKKCIFIFEGFSDLRIILNFFFFFGCQLMPFSYEHCSSIFFYKKNKLINSMMMMIMSHTVSVIGRMFHPPGKCASSHI